ncbi:DUF4365 domain-containing protein [Bifidobacterium tissieri]|uniref:DUF4365 domain-containing protein n=1 Tax=Bifidobacterium tissieri TaxID=1630162 RepID=UPI000B9AA0B8|nr:DUF4365 domain-containing protein [Bifidobacterium tissieri]
MTDLTAAQESYVDLDIHRGMPSRESDLKEQLQIGLVKTIVAAAGCNMSKPEVDNGVDLLLTHECPEKQEICGPLRIQLKATSRKNRWNSDRTRISAKLSHDRYDQFRIDNPAYPMIIVIMDVDPDMQNWYQADDEYSKIRYRCYWVSIQGRAPVAGKNDVIVSAPRSQVFDDVALCTIFGKIRAGEKL